MRQPNRSSRDAVIKRPRRALARLMGTGDDITGPINLGNPEEYSILALAQMIVDLTGSRSRAELSASPQDDPQQRRPTIERARTTLNWAPHTPMRKGLSKTIAHFELFIKRDGTPPLG